MDIQMVQFLAIILFFISIFGLISSKKALKSIVFTLLLQTAVVMFFLGIGYSEDTLPPIGIYVADLEQVAAVADPLPQALMLTAIIISVCVLAINITIIMSLFRKHKTTDWDTLKSGSLER